jgi:hypothetical protein
MSSTKHWRIGDGLLPQTGAPARFIVQFLAILIIAV